jgi:predicted ATP-dependent protease
MLPRLVKESRLRHLSAAAVASALEHSSRLVDDQRRLSARVKDMEDILREADQLAANAGADLIDAEHVDDVILRRAYRVDRIRELVHESITRGITLVDTTGRRVGQINGLSVVQIGKLMFGQPSRITATARLGRGEVHRHRARSQARRQGAHQGGDDRRQLHRRALRPGTSPVPARKPRLRAVLRRHRGDSASIAEVCALISAIIDRPLRQDIAVTGSMDQYGSTQAIGGVNEKIEGFFDVCRVQGLSGTQGVLIPKGNLDNLMLRQDVVDALPLGSSTSTP